MQKNVAGKWIVFAYGLPDHANDGQPITGDAANITANMRIDGATANAIDDLNPTELEDGFYIFDITAVEANGDLLLLTPQSSTGNVQVIGVPGTVWTRPPNFNALGIAADGDISGNIDGLVTAVGANGITSTTLAANCITSSQIAASALDGKGDWNIGKTGYTVSALDAAVITAASIAASALNGKGDWNTVTPDAAGVAPTLSEIINGVIDEALTGHVTADSLGVHLKDVLADVTGINGAAMRGTDGANTTVPDAAGVAPTLAEIVDGLIDETLTGHVTADSLGVHLKDILADVTGINGAAMRGTDGANTVVPDAAGVAPTAVENRIEMDANSTQLAAAVALFTTQLTEAYAADGVAPTPAQALFAIMQGLLEFSIASTTITTKKIDKATTAMTHDLDDATNPTSRTRNT